LTKVRTDGIPGSEPISVEPSLVFVCDSKLVPLLYMAVTIDFRTSDALETFVVELPNGFTPLLDRQLNVPPVCVCPFTKE
jgi:hypothetical protein